METIYLVRSYDVGGYGLKRVDSESLFSSLNSALEKIVKLSELEFSFRYEILQYELNSNQNNSIIDQWHFDRYGMPITITGLCESNQMGEVFPKEDFLVGNFVIPQVLTQWDFSHRDILPISVITGIFDEEKAFYFIDYISELGYLERDHFSKNELVSQFQLYKHPLPSQYSFLRVLSNHYKRIKIIDEKLLRKIYNGDVFLLDVVSYY